MKVFEIINAELAKDDKDKNYIYLGSSSAFVFIGKINDDTVKFINRSDNDFHMGYVNNLPIYEDDLKTKKRIFDEYKDYVNVHIAEYTVGRRHYERSQFLEKEIKRAKSLPRRTAKQKAKRKRLLTKLRHKQLKELYLVDKYYSTSVSIYRRYLYLEEQIGAIERIYEKTKFYAENWVNILDREVIKLYEHKYVEPLGITVIVDGPEIGKYWLNNECENAINKFLKREAIR